MVGDSLEIRVGQLQWHVVVRGLSDKRGSASVASTLYEETPESVVAREKRALEFRLARPFGADLGARPTKLDRRRIEDLPRRDAAALVEVAERRLALGDRELGAHARFPRRSLPATHRRFRPPSARMDANRLC